MTNEEVESNGPQGERPYEGDLGYGGGDVDYRPRSETDPQKILEAARRAAAHHGVAEQAVFVNIPNRGRYKIFGVETVADLDREDQARAIRQTINGALNGLPPDKLRLVEQFVLDMKRK